MEERVYTSRPAKAWNFTAQRANLHLFFKVGVIQPQQYERIYTRLYAFTPDVAERVSALCKGVAFYTQGVNICTASSKRVRCNRNKNDEFTPDNLLGL